VRDDIVGQRGGPRIPSAYADGHGIHTRNRCEALHDQHIGVEHVALALIGMDSGLVPPILLALGASRPALRATILDRYRQAS
jgi:Clp amino terminal domain, pathogenicity island component